MLSNKMLTLQRAALRATQSTSIQTQAFSSQYSRQQQSQQGQKQNFAKSMFATVGVLGGLAALTYSQSDLEMTKSGLLANTRLCTLLQGQEVAECQFQDKNLAKALEKIEVGIKEIEKKYPGYKRPVIKSGLRKMRYYIEFPIVGKNIDAFSLILGTEGQIQKVKETQRGKILSTDSFQNGDNVSYLIDYQVASSTAMGGNSKGSVYIRGIRDADKKYDSFKFILEKSVDFNDLDSDIIIKALEESCRMDPPEPPKEKTNAKRFSARRDSKSGQKDQGGNKDNSEGMTEQTGSDTDEEKSDPVSLLEKHSCSVFLPGVEQNKLDWDYLAGYDDVKRDIEDTVLLALTHGDVYDQITAITRMKNETNRPKCVLFEGPPGCGKTTSAKIISHQVNIPLVYMPLEAIMSKFYGESESRLAEIFEAAQAMGSVILFIDEIDSLATSREAGLHEATRRILSTLLRKIDSFESEGEVLVICATNRKKDLDPALISRTDLSIRFELPNAETRTQIFARYAKQLTQEELKEIGEASVYLSGRDIADICKDAERKWASLYIRKQVTQISPQISVYREAVKGRLLQMTDANVRMDFDVSSPYAGGEEHRPDHIQPLAYGSQ